MTAVTMWTPPKPRAYNPKPADPGQRITWTRHEEGHWTELPDAWGGRMPDTSKYVQPRDIERTGTIWSAGHTGRMVWVQPDDAAPGDMVLVHLGSLLEQNRYDRDWQRSTTLRCNALATSAGLIREHKTERLWHGVAEDRTVAYHTDPDCTAIEHNTDRHLVPAIGDIIRDLLNDKQRTDLCHRCIWLSQPAEAVA